MVGNFAVLDVILIEAYARKVSKFISELGIVRCNSKSIFNKNMICFYRFEIYFRIFKK